MEQLVDNRDLQVNGNWKKLWGKRIPQKVKVFLWCAVRGYLPTRQQLQSRGVNCLDSSLWELLRKRLACFFPVVTRYRKCGLNQVYSLLFNDWWLDIPDGFVSLFFHLLAVLRQHHMQQFLMALWCYMETKEREIVEQCGAMPVCHTDRTWQSAAVAAGSGLCREEGWCRQW